MIQIGIETQRALIPFHTKKAEEVVRNVLDQLRHGRRLRSLITRDSELNLRYLYTWFPTPTRIFLKRLKGLDQLAMLNKIQVPDLLGAPQNRHLLYRLREMGFLFNLIDPEGTLALRRAGLRKEPPHIDLVPKHKTESLEDYLTNLEAHSEKYGKDTELGNIFLSKYFLRSWIDLFRAGEERSACKHRGEEVGMTPALQRIIDRLQDLLNKYPFGSSTERNALREGIETMVKVLLPAPRCNYTAAVAKLTSMINRLNETIFSQIEVRMREERREDKSKLTYDDETGDWYLRKGRYRMTEVELLRKESDKDATSTGLLCSYVENILGNIEREIGENYALMIDLVPIKNNYPDYWDKLFDIYDQFTRCTCTLKEKARVEMGGVLELARIISRDQQPIRLAKSILGVVEKEIELRQRELKGQMTVYLDLIPVVEMIGEKMREFAEPVVQALGNPNITRQPALIMGIEKRLENFVNTFFKGELREEYLQRAKERVVKAKELLAQVRERISEKKGRKDLKTEEVLGKIAEVAKELLLIGLDHENRHGEVITESDFLLRHTDKLDKIKGLAGKKSEIPSEVKRKLIDEISKGGETRKKALIDLMNFLTQTIPQKKSMNSANLAGELRELVAEVRAALMMAGMTETSIMLIMGRVDKIINLFNGICGLIWGKDRQRREAEQALKVKQEYLLRKKLEAIASINNSIMFRLREVAIVALQIKYDLENKPEKEDKEKRQEFVRSHQPLFKAIEELDFEYLDVYLDGKYISTAAPFDVWRLKLATKP